MVHLDSSINIKVEKDRKKNLNSKHIWHTYDMLPCTSAKIHEQMILKQFYTNKIGSQINFVKGIWRLFFLEFLQCYFTTKLRTLLQHLSVLDAKKMNVFASFLDYHVSSSFDMK